MILKPIAAAVPMSLCAGPVGSHHAVAGPSRTLRQTSPTVITLQLLLTLLVVRTFRLEESRGLFNLLLLVTAGFFVHVRLPVAWRPAFFLLLSLASFPLAFASLKLAEVGWQDAAVFGLEQSAPMIGLGLILIAICHLPVAYIVRAALLIFAGAGLVAWRSFETSPFWAVLGSIFMFRLWIYFKAIRRESTHVGWSRRLSYFFLLPNGFFPFFPIVDYRRFRDCYAAGYRAEVAQRGVAWIVRGITHLLAYRVVSIYFLPGQIDLIDLEYVALFMAANYALYLRISGYFHIITGLLHLFGFDLPRTHDRYFLASSFSDIWRRINIYWKDFLTDHVFYPTFFLLRRLPRAAAIASAVGVTFVATWLMHSWQMFWLRGDFPIAARDAALWIAAGGLVAASSLWQYRAALAGAKRSKEVTVASALVLSLKVIGTFATVSFFWACWTVPHFPQLVVAVAMAGGVTSHTVLVVGGTVLALIAGGTLLQLTFARFRSAGLEPSLPLERSPLLCASALGCLAVVGMPAMHPMYGHDVSRHIAALQHETVTADEARRRMEGYYEDLASVNLQSTPLISESDLSAGPRSEYFDALRERNDILEKELIPGWTGVVEGQPFHVNRWGMRDDDLPRRKPPGHYRVAIIGSSVTMGYGVAEDADFETIVERRINETIGDAGPRVEFLNFAEGNYDALHASGILREKAMPFDLDAVFLFADQSEFGLTKRLANASALNYPLPYPCLDEILRDAGVSKDTSWGTTGILLQKKIRETIECTYRGIVADCRAQKVTPVWVYLPMPGFDQLPPGLDEALMQMARDAGFLVIDLGEWAEGRLPESVMDDKYHANALGHRLIAQRLYEALRKQPRALPPLNGAPRISSEPQPR